MDNNKFLFLAYGFLWLVFMIYVWSLSSRQAKIGKDLQELKNKVKGSSAADHPTA